MAVGGDHLGPAGVGRLLGLLWKLHGRLNEPLTLFLMHQRADAIVPGGPDWLEHLEALTTDYLRQDPRPAIRSRLLSLLSGVYGIVRFIYRDALVDRVLVPALVGSTTQLSPMLDADDAIATVALALAIEAAVDCYSTRATVVAPLVAVLERVALADDIVRAVVATRGLVRLLQTTLYGGPTEAAIELFERLVTIATPEPGLLEPEAADESGRARLERARRARAAARLEVLRTLLRLRAQPSGRLYLQEEPAHHGPSSTGTTAPAGPGALPTSGSATNVLAAPLEHRIASTFVRVAPADVRGALPIATYVQCVRPGGEQPWKAGVGRRNR